jgi:glucose-1-phosphate cytidylyltransferase
LKAVILAGGLGTRMKEETEFRPKPMVEIGGRPVIWHIMRGLSQQGVTDFVVLGGYKVDIIKNYFLNLGANTHDFTLEAGNIKLHNLDASTSNWKVTVVDTGEETLTAGRLKLAREFIGEDPFLCTYGDGLANVPIDKLIWSHEKSGKSATLTVYQPENRFGVLGINEIGEVVSFKEKPKMNDWINIGFFIFEPQIWDYLSHDEPLEESPLKNLVDAQQLNAFMHNGFWLPMDTYREYLLLSRLWKEGSAPWKIW